MGRGVRRLRIFLIAIIESVFADIIVLAHISRCRVHEYEIAARCEGKTLAVKISRLLRVRNERCRGLRRCAVLAVGCRQTLLE